MYFERQKFKLHLNRFSQAYVWSFKCLETFLSEYFMLRAEQKGKYYANESIMKGKYYANEWFLST